MSTVAPPSQPATLASLEADARRMAISLDKGRYLCLLVLTVVYAAGAMLHARGKPFWYDEVYTVLFAGHSDASETWKAAQQLDAAPPLTALLTHFAVHWFGQSEITVRLPQIAGFWAFCLSLFWFVRRRLGIFYGLAALLLPLSTQAYDYAYEARPYGIELGFCGLALVAWQAATESRRLRHAAACAALALSLIGALMCHYYAAMLYFPLGLSELYRSWKLRRLDWGVWLGLLVGSVPLIWRLATIRAVVQSFSQTAWSEVHPFDALDFWNDSLQSGLSILVAALAVMAIWAWKAARASGRLCEAGFVASVGNSRRDPVPRDPVLYGGRGIADHSRILPALCIGRPDGRGGAFAVGGGSNGPRPCAGGVRDGGAGRLRLIIVTTTFSPPRDLQGEEFVLVDALKQGPVVVADGQLFFQMFLYLPDSLKANLLFLVDREASVKYQTFNTAAIDSALTTSVGTIRSRPWTTPASPPRARNFACYRIRSSPAGCWRRSRPTAARKRSTGTLTFGNCIVFTCGNFWPAVPAAIPIVNTSSIYKKSLEDDPLLTE